MKLVSLENSSNSELASWQTRHSHVTSTSGGKRNRSQASRTTPRDINMERVVGGQAQRALSCQRQGSG